MSTDFIPQKFAEFDDWQKQFVSGVLTDPGSDTEIPPPPGGANPNYKTWEIPNAKVQGLIDAQALYQPFYDDWSDEDSRTDKIIEDHKREHGVYEKFIRQFINQWVRPNPLVTTGDKADLGLTVPDTTPTPTTLVDYGPVLSIDTIRPGLHKIRVSDTTTPDTSAMPEGHRLELQLHIDEDDNLPDEDIQWSTYKTVGRFLIDVEFEAEDKNKTAYYRAFYVIANGDRSIPSTVFKLGIV